MKGDFSLLGTVMTGLVSGAVSFAVAWFVAERRIRHERTVREAQTEKERRDRRSEWLRDKIGHLTACIRSLERLSSRSASKHSDTQEFLEGKLSLEKLTRINLDLPEAVFDSATYQALEVDDQDDEPTFDLIDDLRLQFEDLNDILGDLSIDSVKLSRLTQILPQDEVKRTAVDELQASIRKDASSLQEHLTDLGATGSALSEKLKAVRRKLVVEENGLSRTP